MIGQPLINDTCTYIMCMYCAILCYLLPVKYNDVTVNLNDK